jgi:NADPH-dependent ferric siderophore reductase
VSALNANTRFALNNAGHIVNQLLDHFVEHADVQRDGTHAKLVLSFGQADVQWDDETVSVDVKSDDETGLAYMKYSIAEHVLEFLDKGSPTPKIIWQGDGAAGLPLPYFREMQVMAVSNVTPHMRRVRLKGDNLLRFSHTGLHIRLLFPPKALAQPEWPVTGEDGRPAWPEGDAKLATRVYTIRNIDVDAGWVDIDMVVHGDDCDAPGSGWALNAKPGDIVGMTGPGGGDAGDAKWYLLAGDETALPAIGRILERLPEDAKAVVRIEIGDKTDEQNLVSRANVDVQWLNRDGAEAGTTTLLQDAVRAVELPEGEEDIFVWAACEFNAFRNIRSYMRKERNVPKNRQLIVAYWRRGLDGDNARKASEE